MMSRQFSTHPITIDKILRGNLGLKKFARRWVPHQLNPFQKVLKIEAAKFPLRILQMLQPNAFDGIAKGGESWFHYVDPSNSMFAPSRDPRMNR
jgi:hypothetical protein